MADHPASHMFLAVSDILAAQNNPSLIYIKISCDGAKERGFSCTVASNNGGKIAVFQCQAHVVKRFFLIDGAGVKRFGNGIND